MAALEEALLARREVTQHLALVEPQAGSAKVIGSPAGE
jgi:hypothetical protein